MFPRTSKGQKPVDMFLANRKNVDMFLEPKVRTGRIVDMFLAAILRTGTENDYLFRSLVPYRIRRSVDSSRVVTMILLTETRFQGTVLYVFDE